MCFVMSHGGYHGTVMAVESRPEERPSFVGSWAPAVAAEPAMPTPPEFPPAQGLPFPFCGVPGAAWNRGAPDRIEQCKTAHKMGEKDQDEVSSHWILYLILGVRPVEVPPRQAFYHPGPRHPQRQRAILLILDCA